MRTSLTHPQHSLDYDRGAEEARTDLLSATFESCRDKFNAKYPNNHQFDNLADYYHEMGYMDKLIDNQKR